MPQLLLKDDLGKLAQPSEVTGSAQDQAVLWKEAGSTLCKLAQPMRQAYDYWQEVPWKEAGSASASILPVCKSYQQRKKGSARLLVLGVYPPQPGQFPAITRMQKLSAVQEATCPPQPGQVPAITRAQKLSTVHETPCRALFRGFRVYIYIYIY